MDYPFPRGYYLFDAKQHDPLSETETDTGGDNACFASWGFTCQQNVARRGSPR